jgi:hypothetical protein
VKYRPGVKMWRGALGPTLLLLALSACGGGGGQPLSPLGAQTFAAAGCGGCLTLAAAGAVGGVGPNLDQLKPDAARVVAQVELGGNGMPSFRDRLSAQQISAVGAYVAGATATSPVVPGVAFRPDATSLGSCVGTGFRCYEQAFGNVAFRQGPAAAISLLQQKLASVPAVQSDCHRITHAIGGGALARVHGDVARAFVGGSTICFSGFYHGILERAFLGLNRGQLAARARSLCVAPAIGSSAFLNYQCLHGLGHGLMIYTGYDLTGSLATCDGLPDRFAQSSCAGGAFMENFFSSYGLRSRFLRANDLIYPCDAVAPRDKYSCYIQVTERILPAVKYDWAKTAAICRRTDRQWVSLCFQSYGRDASGIAGKSAARAIALCRIAGDHESDCIYAVARDIVTNDAGPARAVAFCGRVARRFTARCYNAIGTILASLHAALADRGRACRALTRTYAAQCRAGAGLGPVAGASRPARRAAPGARATSRRRAG